MKNVDTSNCFNIAKTLNKNIFQYAGASLKALRQPRQILAPNYFYSNFYPHFLGPFCEDHFQICMYSFRENWEINLTIWRTVPYFNP